MVWAYHWGWSEEEHSPAKYGEARKTKKVEELRACVGNKMGEAPKTGVIVDFWG